MDRKTGHGVEQQQGQVPSWTSGSQHVSCHSIPGVRLLMGCRIYKELKAKKTHVEGHVLRKTAGAWARAPPVKASRPPSAQGTGRGLRAWACPQAGGGELAGALGWGTANGLGPWVGEEVGSQASTCVCGGPGSLGGWRSSTPAGHPTGRLGWGPMHTWEGGVGMCAREDAERVYCK